MCHQAFGNLVPRQMKTTPVATSRIACRACVRVLACLIALGACLLGPTLVSAQEQLQLRPKTHREAWTSRRSGEILKDFEAWSWGGRGDLSDVSSNASWLDMTRSLLGRNVPSEEPLTP